jgi:hypothetical protein
LQHAFVAGSAAKAAGETGGERSQVFEPGV